MIETVTKMAELIYYINNNNNNNILYNYSRRLLCHFWWKYFLTFHFTCSCWEFSASPRAPLSSPPRRVLCDAARNSCTWGPGSQSPLSHQSANILPPWWEPSTDHCWLSATQTRRVKEQHISESQHFETFTDQTLISRQKMDINYSVKKGFK